MNLPTVVPTITGAFFCDDRNFRFGPRRVVHLSFGLIAFVAARRLYFQRVVGLGWVPCCRRPRSDRRFALSLQACNGLAALLVLELVRLAGTRLLPNSVPGLGVGCSLVPAVALHRLDTRALLPVVLHVVPLGQTAPMVSMTVAGLVASRLPLAELVGS